MYLRLRLYKYMMLLALIGAINWGLVGGLDFNLVTWISSIFGRYANSVEDTVYVMVGLCGLLLLLHRDTYLPFLGPAVYPTPNEDKVPIISGNSTKVTIKKLPPNIKVVYWAAQSSLSVWPNPTDAYGNYSNMGIGTSNKDGELEVTIATPASYVVKMRGELKPHLHYRTWCHDGMMSPVKTLRI